MRPGFTTAVLLVLLLIPRLVSAQIPDGFEGEFEPHPEAEDAIEHLYSPYCPGFMLDVCPSPQGIALRDSIQALAYEGWSSEELVEWVVANHGAVYRASPSRSGWGLWAWVLPPLALLLGVALVIVTLRKFAPGDRVERPAESGRDVSDLEENRLREAIREIELSEDPSL